MAPSMLNYHTGSNELPIFFFDSTFWYRGPVMIPNVEGESFGELVWVDCGILPLIMDVDMGLARVP